MSTSTLFSFPTRFPSLIALSPSRHALLVLALSVYVYELSALDRYPLLCRSPTLP